MDVLYPLVLTSIAGASTVLGALFYLPFRKKTPLNLNFFLGISAGVMLYLSFVELLPGSIEVLGGVTAHVLFFLGIGLMGLLDWFFPHHIFFGKACVAEKKHTALFQTGIMVALGLGLHNIPEGIAVFTGAASDSRLGLLLAIAITLHNIPEGMAIAAPLIHATKRVSVGIKYAAIAGVAEPIGGLIAFLLFAPYLSAWTTAGIFAVVSGVMVYVSFDELLPVCFKDRGKMVPIAGITIGMIVTAVSMMLLGE